MKKPPGRGRPGVQTIHGAPWPGSIDPMSLMFSSRLTMDSEKSPAVAEATVKAPSSALDVPRVVQQQPGLASEPTTTERLWNPKKPSQDFLG